MSERVRDDEIGESTEKDHLIQYKTCNYNCTGTVHTSAKGAKAHLTSVVIIDNHLFIGPLPTVTENFMQIC